MQACFSQCVTYGIGYIILAQGVIKVKGKMQLIMQKEKGRARAKNG